MSNVEFDSDQTQFRSQMLSNQGKPTGMTAWLLNKGIIKDASKASNFLLAFVGIAILATIVIFYYFV